MAGSASCAPCRPADPRRVAKFRRQARALGRPWPEEQRYGDYLRELDGTRPEAPGDPARGVVAVPRRRVHAVRRRRAREHRAGGGRRAVRARDRPLRRLVDRFGLAICEAHVGGHPGARVGARGPARAAEGDGALEQRREPARPHDARRRRGGGARAAHRRGVRRRRAVGRAGCRARPQRTTAAPCSSPTRPSRRVCDGHLEPGTDVRVRLVEADIATGTVRFDARLGMAACRNSPRCRRSSPISARA